MDADVGNDFSAPEQGLEPALVQTLTNAQNATLYIRNRPDQAVTIYKLNGVYVVMLARPPQRLPPRAAAQPPPTAPLVAPPRSADQADAAAQAGAPAPLEAESWPPLPQAQRQVVRWAREQPPPAASPAAPHGRPTGDGRPPAAQPADLPDESAPTQPPAAGPDEDPRSWARCKGRDCRAYFDPDGKVA